MAQAAEERDGTARDRREAAGDGDARKQKRWKVLLPLVVIALIAGIIWWLHSRGYESTDDAFIEGDIIPVNARVAGPVDKVEVDDNQKVDAGQVLAVLDLRDIQARLDAAQAALAVANAAVESAKAASSGAEADVAAAQAEENRRSADLQRYERLDPRVVSRQQYDAAKAGAETARASLRAAQTRSLAAHAQIGEAEARVRQAEANLRKAELDLTYGSIRAPVAGRVTRKTVQPGQYLEVGQLLMSIVPENVWVLANFKETQLTDIRPGQRVEIEVDTYPDLHFTGKVDSIQAGSGARFSLLPPENATGNYVKVVQRVPVKIVFDPPAQHDVLLGPGMSVVPSIDLDSLNDAHVGPAGAAHADTGGR